MCAWFSSLCRIRHRGCPTSSAQYICVFGTQLHTVCRQFVSGARSRTLTRGDQAGMQPAFPLGSCLRVCAGRPTMGLSSLPQFTRLRWEDSAQRACRGIFAVSVKFLESGPFSSARTWVSRSCGGAFVPLIPASCLTRRKASNRTAPSSSTHGMNLFLVSRRRAQNMVSSHVYLVVSALLRRGRLVVTRAFGSFSANGFGRTAKA